MFTCILLAAGLNTRFGSPKALAQINAQPIIQHLHDTWELVPEPIELIIVLGAHAKRIESALKPLPLSTKIVINNKFTEGQTCSFKKGLQHVNPKSQGIFLQPVDTPFIKTSTIQTLCLCFKTKSPLIIIPTFLNKRGHPPLFHPSLIPEFFALKNNVGLNTLLKAHHQNIHHLAVKDPGVIENFNTKEEFKQLKKNHPTFKNTPS